jgi:hemerythrin superfamily protein
MAGGMDALELLTADHNRVRGLFARFKKAEESDDTATATEVAAKIVEELTVHTTIEEEIFYPAITGCSEEIKDVVEEGWQEHLVAKKIIDELGQCETASDSWMAKVKVLIESVEHHAEEEEKEMFPKVRSAVTDEGRTDLGMQLTERKKSLGAPTMEEAIDLTKEELLAKAREQEIPGRSKMAKDELAATVDPRG